MASAGVLYVWSRREFSSAIDRSSVGGIQRAGVQRFDPLDRARRAAREPEATVAREALLRREVVDVERGGIDPQAARGRRSVDDDERVGAGRAVHRHDHAGRRLVVRVGVHVALDVIGKLRARPGSVSHTCGSSRCGAARATAANFDENSPITTWVLRCAIRPKTAASQNSVEPPLPISTS